MTVGWPDFTDTGLQYLQLDQLVNDNTTLLAPSHSFNTNQRRSYAGLMISVSPALACNVTVLVFDGSLASQNWTQRKAAAGGGATVTFFSPIPLQGINTATVQITCSVNQASGSGVEIYGVSMPLPAALGGRLLRTDLRDYPTGSLAAQGTNAAGGTLVAAPGAGIHILLSYISIALTGPAGAVAFVDLAATINGLGAVVAFAGAPAGAEVGAVPPLPPGGILLDANTALTYGTGGPPAAVTILTLYDLVA